MTKKIVSWIALALALGAMILGIIWLSFNWDNLTAGTGIYTEKDLNDKYNEGLQDGLERGEEWRVLVLQYKEKLSEYENEVKNLTIALEEEKSKNNANEDKIATLEEELSLLNSEKLSLQNEVKRLEMLLEAYEDIKVGTFEVDFYLQLNEGKVLYSTEVIRKGSTISMFEIPDTDSYVFDHWENEDGETVNPFEIEITEDTVFNGIVKYYEIVANFQVQEWNYSNVAEGFVGSNIWTDGVRFFYSNGSSQNVLDTETSTWERMTWTGLTNFDGENVWTDGTDIYYSNYSIQYVLDKNELTWNKKKWNGDSPIYGSCVWTDGQNIYWSKGTGYHFILDKGTSTWTEKNWNGFTGFTGESIWTDGTNIYCSDNDYQYVLDIETSTWEVKTWIGLTNFYGKNVWTDGKCIYYSNKLEQYTLNLSTSTWGENTWNDSLQIYGDCIWTDGISYFYSNGINQYELVYIKQFI